MENNQAGLLVGIDEAGRGPIAGPVTAAAVILSKPIDGLTDSKKLTESQREKLAKLIKKQALSYAIGQATCIEIDEINILQASLLAMARAVQNLGITPTEGLVDGLHIPPVDFPCRAIVKGDLLIPAISAASILAKVSRDSEMKQYDVLYPGYGFAGHKGYPTKAHIEALTKLGVSPIHRKSFSPVKRCLQTSLSHVIE